MSRRILKRVLCEITGKKENGEFMYSELGDTNIELKVGTPITFLKEGFTIKTDDVITNFTDLKDTPPFSSVTLNDEKYLIKRYVTTLR